MLTRSAAVLALAMLASCGQAPSPPAAAPTTAAPPAAAATFTRKAAPAGAEPVAAAMAEGVRQRLGADIGVAVTGIAGPGGGTAEKPVGTVCFAVAGPGVVSHVETRRVPGDRGLIRHWSVMVALDLVRRALASAG